MTTKNMLILPFSCTIWVRNVIEHNLSFNSVVFSL